PYLLGFRPERCVVLVGSRDAQRRPTARRGHPAFVSRIDLPPAPDDDTIVDVIVEAAVRARLRVAALVVYAGSAELVGAGQPLVGRVVARLSAGGVAVKEAIRVDGDRWWGYLCGEHGCCAGAGHRVVPPDRPGGSSLIAAQAVAQGMVPLQSRAALAESIRPVSEIAFAAIDQALAEVLEKFARQAADAGGAWRRLRLSTLRLVEELLERGETGSRIELSPAQAALLLVGLQDDTTRDLCLGWTSGERGRAAIQLWTQLIRMAPPPLGAVPATLLAYVAWQRGGGAIVTIALDRAFAHDPSDRMAGLLAKLVFSGMDPADFAPSHWMEAREIGEDLELCGGASRRGAGSPGPALEPDPSGPATESGSSEPGPREPNDVADPSPANAMEARCA
ncbi:MAG: DUF4192 domain-containing protein, partial [Candidatus Limnocylindria bacterium]